MKVLNPVFGQDQYEQRKAELRGRLADSCCGLDGFEKPPEALVEKHWELLRTTDSFEKMQQVKALFEAKLNSFLEFAGYTTDIPVDFYEVYLVTDDSFGQGENVYCDPDRNWLYLLDKDLTKLCLEKLVLTLLHQAIHLLSADFENEVSFYVYRHSGNWKVSDAGGPLKVTLKERAVGVAYTQVRVFTVNHLSAGLWDHFFSTVEMLARDKPKELAMKPKARALLEFFVLQHGDKWLEAADTFVHTMNKERLQRLRTTSTSKEFRYGFRGNELLTEFCAQVAFLLERGETVGGDWKSLQKYSNYRGLKALPLLMSYASELSAQGRFALVKSVFFCLCSGNEEILAGYLRDAKIPIEASDFLTADMSELYPGNWLQRLVGRIRGRERVEVISE